MHGFHDSHLGDALHHDDVSRTLTARDRREA